MTVKIQRAKQGTYDKNQGPALKAGRHHWCPVADYLLVLWGLLQLLCSLLLDWPCRSQPLVYAGVGWWCCSVGCMCW
jgi:hypothetical protein